LIPPTYVLPDQFPDFMKHYEKNSSENKANFWIIKPKALSRGRGIYIVLIKR